MSEVEERIKTAPETRKPLYFIRIQEKLNIKEILLNESYMFIFMIENRIRKKKRQNLLRDNTFPPLVKDENEYQNFEKHLKQKLYIFISEKIKF